jgi:hypothetical protein
MVISARLEPADALVYGTYNWGKWVSGSMEASREVGTGDN